MDDNLGKYFTFESKSFNSIECWGVNKKEAPERIKDFLTIIGTSNSVFKDVERFGIHGDIAVVNDAGFYYKEYQHFVSAHGNFAELVTEYKKKFRPQEKRRFISHTAHTYIGIAFEKKLDVDYMWKFEPGWVTSGLFAIWMGIALGYKAILTHGITFDLKNHFYDFEEMYCPEQFDRFFIKAKNSPLKEIIEENNIKFSSGRLGDYFGIPDKRWLSQNIKRYC